MTELRVLRAVQVAPDLHVRSATGEKVVELVRIGLVFRMLAWRIGNAEGIPLLQQCTLDARFCGRTVQTRHVLSLGSLRSHGYISATCRLAARYSGEVILRGSF